MIDEFRQALAIFVDSARFGAGKPDVARAGSEVYEKVTFESENQNVLEMGGKRNVLLIRNATNRLFFPF